MLIKNPERKAGLYLLSQRHNLARAAFMNIDSHLWISQTKEKKSFYSDTDEIAFLVQKGLFVIKSAKQEWTFERQSLWDEVGQVLLIPAQTPVEIVSQKAGQMLILQTANENLKTIHYFDKTNTQSQIFGQGVWDNTALRVVREYFSVRNVPQSNLVLGEVITYPGRWSSYLPHYHPQPEMYFFQFDKPSAFGLSLNGPEAKIVTHNDLHAIPGGNTHPVSAAPGYPLYYAWILSQSPDKPWNQRIEAPQHLWLKETNVSYWSKDKIK